VCLPWTGESTDPPALPIQARAVRTPAPGASRVTLSIPSVGVRDLVVVPYLGHADDSAGTVIEDKGLVASPRGPHGRVAPGQVGNALRSSGISAPPRT
jgi:sortase A